MLNQDEKKEWKSHPVTREYLKALGELKSNREKELRSASSWDDFNKKVGELNQLDEIIDHMETYGREDEERDHRSS